MGIRSKTLLKLSFKKNLYSVLSLLLRIIIIVPIVLGVAFFADKHLSYELAKVVEALGLVIVILGVATILEKHRFGLTNIISGLIILFIGMNFLGSVVYGLSNEEKLADLEYLHGMVTENYPFLSANERTYGFNWLAREQSYRESIENNTDADTNVISNNMFATEISKVVHELYNSLTHPITSNYFWSHQVLTNPQYNNKFSLWEEVLNEENVLKWYGFGLEEGQQAPNPYSEVGLFYIDPDNYRLNIRSFRKGIIVPGEVAYLRIYGMNRLRVDADGELIREFLEEIRDYDQLIIDIRDNGGGVDEYWKQNLIAPLINEQISVDSYFFVRGDYSKKFYGSRDIKLFPVSELDEKLVASFPEGIQEDFHYYGIHTETVEPINPVDFKGDIYLITNRSVRGSAEKYSNFVKDAGLATLVGGVTAGNAPIFEPIIFSLPNSGMVIRYRGELAINGDGNITSHVGTIPHIPIENVSIRVPAYEVDEPINYILQNR